MLNMETASHTPIKETQTSAIGGRISVSTSIFRDVQEQPPPQLFLWHSYGDEVQFTIEYSLVLNSVLEENVGSPLLLTLLLTVRVAPKFVGSSTAVNLYLPQNSLMALFHAINQFLYPPFIFIFVCEQKIVLLAVNNLQTLWGFREANKILHGQNEFNTNILFQLNKTTIIFYIQEEHVFITYFGLDPTI